MLQKKQVRFILNPISGGRTKKNIPGLIQQHLRSDLFDYEIRYTESAQHTKELAREAVVLQKDMVVAAGGDGTLNLVAGELIGTKIALGIVPLGSGNGFARALKIPLQTEEAIKVLNEESRLVMDTGTANQVPFINVCGFGFDAHVSNKFAEAGSRGFKTYARISLREWRSYKPMEYRITTGDGEFTQKAFLMAICNGQQYGNNAYIAPKADFSDAWFDLTILSEINLKNILGLIFDLFQKNLHRSKSAKSLRVKNMQIEQATAGYVNIDGEPIWFEKNVDICMHPLSLHVMVPDK